MRRKQIIMSSALGKYPLRAIQQWNELRNQLVREDRRMYGEFDVIVMKDFGEGCDVSVFAGRNGLVFKEHFLYEKQDTPDCLSFQSYFSSHQFYLHDSLGSFRGAADALFDIDKNILWYGVDVNSSIRVKLKLEALVEDIDIVVRPLRLVGEWPWLNLEKCFCPLDTGEVLWYPEAFDSHSQYVIRTWYQGRNIAVSEEDAKLMACSSVNIGNRIIMPLVSDDLVAMLTNRGYVIDKVDVSEFVKDASCGCKSLTLEVVS